MPEAQTNSRRMKRTGRPLAMGSRRADRTVGSRELSPRSAASAMGSPAESARQGRGRCGHERAPRERRARCHCHLGTAVHQRHEEGAPARHRPIWRPGLRGLFFRTVAKTADAKPWRNGRGPVGFPGHDTPRDMPRRTRAIGPSGPDRSRHQGSGGAGPPPTPAKPRPPPPSAWRDIAAAASAGPPTTGRLFETPFVKAHGGAHPAETEPRPARGPARAASTPIAQRVAASPNLETASARRAGSVRKSEPGADLPAPRRARRPGAPRSIRPAPCGFGRRSFSCGHRPRLEDALLPDTTSSLLRRRGQRPARSGKGLPPLAEEDRPPSFARAERRRNYDRRPYAQTHPRASARVNAPQGGALAPSPNAESGSRGAAARKSGAGYFSGFFTAMIGPSTDLAP